jgi:hypothetical protein
MVTLATLIDETTPPAPLPHEALLLRCSNLVDTINRLPRHLWINQQVLRHPHPNQDGRVEELGEGVALCP